MENPDEKSSYNWLDEPICTPEDYYKVRAQFVLAAIIGIAALFGGAWLGKETCFVLFIISFFLFVSAFDSWKDWFADQMRRQERPRKNGQFGNEL